VAGKLLDINPFDEPNVSESKQNTGRLLDYYQQRGSLPETTPVATQDGVSLYTDDRMFQMLRDLCQQHQFDSSTLVGLVAAQVNSTSAGDYFALLAYLPMTDENNELLEDIRRRLRHATRRAVTLGYGPRFQHSTGQLHKGGANNGIFIQITCDDPEDLAIPDAVYSFGVLKAAQAAGDLEALQSKGRRAMRIHVGHDAAGGLQKLSEAINLAAERRH
jgi:hypothetical protein